MALFEAAGLHKRFGDQVVLQDITPGVRGRAARRASWARTAPARRPASTSSPAAIAPDRGRVTLRRRGHHRRCRRAAIARKGISRSFQVDEPVRRLHGARQRAARPAARARARLRRLARPARRRAARAAGRARCWHASAWPARSTSPRAEPVLRRAARARDRRRARRRAAPAVPRRADRRASAPKARRGSPSWSASSSGSSRSSSSSTTCASCSASPTPSSVHPLGPGDRRGHAGRAARQRLGAALQPRSAGDASAADASSARCCARRRHLLRRDAGAVRRLARGRRAARSSPCSAPTAPARRRLLRSILGLTPARRGSDRASTAATSRARRRTRSPARGIGWVPDDRRIFPTLTVARNLAIARKKTRFRAWTREASASRSSARSST